MNIAVAAVLLNTRTTFSLEPKLRLAGPSRSHRTSRRWWRRKRPNPLAPVDVSTIEDELEAIHSSAAALAQNFTISDRALQSWPGDVTAPVVSQFAAFMLEARALVQKWGTVTTQSYKAQSDYATQEATLAQENATELDERMEEIEAPVKAARAQRAVAPVRIVAGWAIFVIAGAAGAADFVVLSRVFQELDESEGYIEAYVLAGTVSGLILVGGYMLGRWAMGKAAGWRAGTIILGMLLVILSVSIAGSRIAVAELSEDATGVIVSVRTIVGVLYLAIQLSAFGLAAAAGFLGHGTAYQYDVSTVERWIVKLSRWRGKRRLARAKKAVTIAQYDYVAIQEAIPKVEDAAMARLAAARAAAVTRISQPLGFGAFRAAEVGESDLGPGSVT